jgi:hypothetical protein
MITTILRSSQARRTAVCTALNARRYVSIAENKMLAPLSRFEANDTVDYEAFTLKVGNLRKK